MIPTDPGPYIAVVGAGDASGRLYELATEVGRLVAERGGTVVCGGLGGVMEAAARGASEAGHRSIVSEMFWRVDRRLHGGR